jgi:hypothetical protein
VFYPSWIKEKISGTKAPEKWQVGNLLKMEEDMEKMLNKKET